MAERYTYRGGRAHWRTSCNRFYVVKTLDSVNGPWCVRAGVPASVLGEIAESGIFARGTFFPTRTAAARALADECRSAGIAAPGRLRGRSDEWSTVDGSIDLTSTTSGPRTWAALVKIGGQSEDGPTYDRAEGFPTRAAATAWARERQRSGEPGRSRFHTIARM